MLWFQGARSGLTEPDPATARSLARGPGPGGRFTRAAGPGWCHDNGHRWLPPLLRPGRLVAADLAAGGVRRGGRVRRAPARPGGKAGPGGPGTGSGGGHSASHLRPRFTMTLVDASSEMLAV